MDVSKVIDEPIVEEHLHMIEEFVFLGDQWSAEESTPDNIEVILSVHNHSISKKSGIEYHWIRAEDWRDEDLLTYFPEAIHLISECVDQRRPILVHCAAGISRSATIVCAYVMSRYKRSVDEAIELVKNKREIIRPNPGFLRQLKMFYEMGFSLNANNTSFKNFLVRNYLEIRINHKIDKYFERMAVAQDMTAEVESGQVYCCSRCGQKLFSENSVIRNKQREDSTQCPDVYIYPQKWMSGPLQDTCVRFPYPKWTEVNHILKNTFPESHNCLINCWNCDQELVTFDRFLTPYQLHCGCVVHRRLDSIVKFKVIAGAIKVDDSNGNDWPTV